MKIFQGLYNLFLQLLAPFMSIFGSLMSGGGFTSLG